MSEGRGFYFFCWIPQEGLISLWRAALVIFCFFLLPITSIYAGEKPIILRMSTISAEKHPVTAAARYFAETVENKTEGQIKIEVFHGGVLGGEIEMQDMVSIGIVQMAVIGNGIAPTYNPQFLLLQIPYIWDNPDQMIAFSNSPLQQEMNEYYRKVSGIRVLASNWDQGTRHTISKNPIQTIKDFNNFKIRIPQLPIWIDAWRRIGANPVQIPFPEVYTALQQGVVDGMECPLDWIEAYSFYEQAKYVTLTGHVMYFDMVIINDKVFSKLSPRFQKILTDAAVKAGEYETKLIRELQVQVRSKMENAGAKFSEIDRAALTTMVEPVYDQWEKVYGKELSEKLKVFKTSCHEKFK